MRPVEDRRGLIDGKALDGKALDRIRGCQRRCSSTECTHRLKIGFTFPFDPWMKGPWRDELKQNAIGAGATALQGLIRNHELARCWDRYQAGHVHWSRPWSLYALSRMQGV